jgi:hypothetical protein
MSAPEEVYILLETTQGVDTVPLVAHTTEQGAAMEMVSYPPDRQRHMWVAPVRLVDDHDD